MIDNLGMVYFRILWMPQCFIDAEQYSSLVMTNLAIENGPEDNQDHVLKRWDPK